MIMLPDKKGNTIAVPHSQVEMRLLKLKFKKEDRDRNFDAFCRKYFLVKS